MPNVGKEAQKAWKEAKESWEMVVELERESLRLTEAEAEKNHDLIMEKLRQAQALVKKRNSALRRYLHHLKNGD
jgi:hypothetical protein